MRLSSDGRYHELRGELGRLDLVKLRVRVHALLPVRGDREAFDAATVDASHERLVDAGSRAIVRAELLASYMTPERVSGEVAVPVARIRLVRAAG